MSLTDAARAELELELRRLVLAASDMKQAAAAADHLVALGHTMNGDVERVLWTGMVVTYARPFGKSNRIEPVGIEEGEIGELADEKGRALHKNLSDRRNDLFAHNDVTAARTIVSTQALLGIGTGGYEEDYALTNQGALPAISKLAQELEQRFDKRILEIEKQLGHGIDQ